MHEDALEDQQALVELIEEAGWDVTDAELSVYESPWEDGDDPEASVTITAKKVYARDDDADDDDGNPYRVD